jgi:lipopolysaccharide export LptBFGC system permease protein LptF
MAFFSNEISNALQYFTFPMEVIGLTLALIEVRFPRVAEGIVNAINLQMQRQRDSYRIIAETKLGRTSEKLESTMNDLLMAVAGLLSKKAAGWLRQDYEKRQANRMALPTWMRWFFWIWILALTLLIAAGVSDNMLIGNSVYITMIAVVFVSLYVVQAGYSTMLLADRWVPGRAVGTVGIIIAGFGVLGEAYQFTTQLVV